MKPVLEVLFFATGSGNETVLEWLCGFPSTDRRSIGEDIKTVQFGWPMGMPLVRSLGGGIWEVRCRLDNRIARVLFALEGATMVSSKSSKPRRSRISPWRETG